MYTPINQWAEDDRPREKFLLKGKSTLSDSELLAILIGSGSRNESAVQLCQRILASSENNLNTLGKMSVAQLTQFKGIGEAKAISIAAALELGRRRRAEDAIELKKINSSKAVFEIMQPIIGGSSFFFKRLKILSNYHSLNELSMGMSNDYEDAINCGSTWIRIGSSIFNKD